MATRIDDLYEADFYAWTREQAKALRALKETRPNVPIDWEHLIEEVRSLGKSERDTVRSHLRTIIEHLLKLRHSPAEEPRADWLATVDRTRDDLGDKLSPTLARDARRHLAEIYGQARRRAARALVVHGEQAAAEILPEACPWTLAQLLDSDWWPGEPSR